MGVPVRYRLSIIGAAVLFSTGGAAIKSCALTGWQVACFRSIVASVALAVLIPSARRNWTWRTPLVGLAYAATMILYVLATKLTTAANAIFLQSTAPLYILLLAPVLLKERVRARDLVLMVVIAFGLTLFFIDIDPAVATAPNPLVGNLMGAAAGVAWALCLLGLRWLERRGDGPAAGLSAVIAGNVVACLVAFPLAFPVAAVAAFDWAMIGYLGLVQIGVAYLFLTYGFKKVPAFEASLLILFEPTLNPVWAWVFNAEVPGNWALVGGGIILTASVIKSWLERLPAPRSVSQQG